MVLDADIGHSTPLEKTEAHLYMKWACSLGFILLSHQDYKFMGTI